MTVVLATYNGKGYLDEHPASVTCRTTWSSKDSTNADRQPGQLRTSASTMHFLWASGPVLVGQTPPFVQRNSKFPSQDARKIRARSSSIWSSVIR
jgi:hypothetical protein